MEERNETLKQIFDDIQNLNDSKADEQKHLKLKERMDNFESIETIKAIKEIFMPRVTSFIALIDKLENSHEELREIIRDFDLTMMKKANKSMVDEQL